MQGCRGFGQVHSVPAALRAPHVIPSAARDPFAGWVQSPCGCRPTVDGLRTEIFGDAQDEEEQVTVDSPPEAVHHSPCGNDGDSRDDCHGGVCLGAKKPAVDQNVAAVGHRVPLVSIHRPWALDRETPSMISCTFSPSANDGENAAPSPVRIALTQSFISMIVGRVR